MIASDQESRCRRVPQLDIDSSPSSADISCAEVLDGSSIVVARPQVDPVAAIDGEDVQELCGPDAGRGR